MPSRIILYNGKDPHVLREGAKVRYGAENQKGSDEEWAIRSEGQVSPRRDHPV